MRFRKSRFGRAGFFAFYSKPSAVYIPHIDVQSVIMYITLIKKEHMITRSLSFIIALISGIAAYGQFDSLILPYRTNMAVLMVNYSTYAFEGGNLAYYDCEQCDYQQIPFQVEYVSPADFGITVFRLIPSNELVFSGTIIWSGTGEILYPTDFSLATPFSDNGAAISKPSDMVYYDVQGDTTTDTLYTNPSDLVWDAIKDLEVVQAFDDAGFKSAIFLYAPGVGVFNPAVVKWVVFLYHQGIATSVEIPKKKSFEVFPNPAQQSITIRHELNTGAQLSIISISGQIVHSQTLISPTSVVDVSSIPVGPYFIQVQNEKEAITTSFIKTE